MLHLAILKKLSLRKLEDHLLTGLVLKANGVLPQIRRELVAIMPPNAPRLDSSRRL
jgi:hypothetical protein